MEEIKLMIRAALERGEDMHSVVASLINAGYNREDVIKAANEILYEEKGRIKEREEEKEVKKEKEIKKEEKEMKKIGKVEVKKKVRLKLDASFPILIISSIILLYPLFLFILNYKNYITLIWILFCFFVLLLNIFSFFRKDKKILLLLSIFIFLCFLIFNIVIYKNNFFYVMKILASKEKKFILVPIVFSYVLHIFSLLLRKD